jgi:hypothetical protein
MINRDEIEAGDKVYTRDGGCLVARSIGETVMLGDCGTAKWVQGKFLARDIDHPLDIIRIEKAPKPVVEEVYVVYSGREWGTDCTASGYHKAIKLTIINGKLEKSEQVK